MIDALARLLAAAFPESDGEHLADALWLAATCGGTAASSLVSDGTGDGSVSAEVTLQKSAAEVVGPNIGPNLALPGGSPGSTAFGSVGVTEVGLRIAMRSPPTLTTAAALSLFRRVHRPGRPTVDVDATVEATADAQRLVVVTRPELARGLDVAVVVDQTPVALVWADAIDELEGTLRRTGAFRSVTRWSLDRSVRIASNHEPSIRDDAGAVHRAGHIIDPAGRRLVLLLTDGAADDWRRAGIWQVLRQWAQAMPTALVHLLPESYWGYTAVGQPTTIIRSRRPAGPNSSVEVRAAWWSDEEEARTGVPLPLIELTPDSIARWTRAVVTGSSWTEAIWTHLPQAAGSDRLSAADQVRAFQTRASGGAQQLARILAGAPLLSLPLMRILHEHLVPQPATGQLAELLVSGLLENLPDNPGHSNLLLRFRPGVADLLYQGTTTSQEWDVFDLLTRYLERNAGPGNAVRAVLADPSGSATSDGDLIPFAALGRGMARRLGLDHGELAGQSASAAITNSQNRPSNIVSRWEDVAGDAGLVLHALATTNTRQGYRTVNGLAKETKLSDRDVQAILDKYPQFVFHSSIPKSDLHELYRLRGWRASDPERVARVITDDDSLSARALGEVAQSLPKTGEHTEALSEIQEAVAINRRLFEQDDPGAQPDLAMSLTSLSGRLSDVGRPEDALTASEEATAHYRELAAARPDAFTPDLAISLNTLSAMLSAVGRREDALAASEEATALYRQLAAAHPDALTPDLARSLNNLSASLSALGRHEDALSVSKEAAAVSQN